MAVVDHWPFSLLVEGEGQRYRHAENNKDKIPRIQGLLSCTNHQVVATSAKDVVVAAIVLLWESSMFQAQAHYKLKTLVAIPGPSDLLAIAETVLPACEGEERLHSVFLVSSQEVNR